MSTPSKPTSVLRSLVALMGGELMSRLIAFAATAYLARVLGPQGFGLVGFALALTGYVSVSITAGLNTVGAREVARLPSAAASLAASVISFRSLLAGVALVMLCVITLVLPRSTDERIIIALFGLTFIPLAIDSAWVHKGLEQNRRVAAALVLTQCLYVVVVLATVKGPADAFVVPIALACAQFIAALYLTVPMLLRQPIRLDVRAGYDLFKRSSRRIWTKLSRLLLYTFDVILLALWYGDEMVGVYVASYRICFLLTALSTGIATAYLPALARAAHEAPAQVSAVLARAIETTFAIGLPLAVGGILVARPLLEFMFGLPYATGDAALQMLLVGVGCAFLRELLQSVLLAYDKLQQELWIMVAGTAANIALNLLLIPVWGIEGAALSTMAAEALILLLCLRAVGRLATSVRGMRLLRIVFAAVIMAAVVTLLGDVVHVAWRVMAGAGAYAASLILMKAVPTDLQGRIPALASVVNGSSKRPR